MQPDMPAISQAQIKRIRSLRIKKFRDETHSFVAEGRKSVCELLARFVPVLLVIRDDAPPLDGFLQIVRANRRQMEQLSSLVTPTDYLAVFNIPEQTADNIVLPGRILALDGVQDPGNLGTIIRTCDWMGFNTVLCSPQTADCYAPKVVQATMGALARVRLVYGDLPSALRSLRQQGYELTGTTLDGDNVYASDALRNAGKTVIVMGNEGNGITPEVKDMLTQRITIPSFAREHVESLNVSIATAIILSEIRRKQ
ncbi:MAG: RNA methyltransferase [Paludibacteraceae bacterium]|nr:RNA methyltransferase [Paludibacteraceae bacterium]